MKKQVAALVAAMMMILSTLGVSAQSSDIVTLGYMNGEMDIFMVLAMETNDPNVARMMTTPPGAEVFFDSFGLFDNYATNGIAYRENATTIPGAYEIVIPELRNADAKIIAYSGDLDFYRGVDDGMIAFIAIDSMVYIVAGYETELEPMVNLMRELIDTEVLPDTIDDFDSEVVNF